MSKLACLLLLSVLMSPKNANATIGAADATGSMVLPKELVDGREPQE
jgi:hypothetical protein